ncbi:MAG: hypothetical protein IEMM0002_0198 [bacterium]|nr:MAG: hypothetical protein IEMM0002_0198 [bacterium]
MTSVACRNCRENEAAIKKPVVSTTLERPVLPSSVYEEGLGVVSRSLLKQWANPSGANNAPPPLMLAQGEDCLKSGLFQGRLNTGKQRALWVLKNI